MSDAIQRRQFLKLSAGTAISSVISPGLLRAEETMGDIYQKIIPAHKGLDAAWGLSLVNRGVSHDAGISCSDKQHLPHIGMTVGGIGCGTVYLSGDGRLYVWDVFNQPHQGVVANQIPIPKGLENINGSGKRVRECDGANYLAAPSPDSCPNPFRQGFVLKLDADKPRAMDGSSWETVHFTGRWPLGIIDYSDPTCPLVVKLESWTPFIPLSTLDSSLPVTVMEFTLENKSDQTVTGQLIGEWENPVLVHTRKNKNVKLNSQLKSESGFVMLLHEAENAPAHEGDGLHAADYGTAALILLGEHAQPAGKTITSELMAGFNIPPSGKTTIRFLLTWHFPNMQNLPGLGKQTMLYATRFPDAAAVAREVVKRFSSLRDATMQWVKTWNDSSLPQWLLDRTILTTNTLQTTTCQVLGSGRFWAWEGVGCCPGTCGHVWHYAQGVARLFPDLERNLREVTDFGVAMNADGSIRFRAEAAGTVAIDAQTGVILRAWREHLFSPNNEFLKRIWPAAKRALQWLIHFDQNGRGGLDGLLDGMQHNTLDAEWYGKVHCLCSLYLAALRAGEEMAKAIGDADFAKTCSSILAMGAEKIDSLFNGEFYTQEEDPAHLSAIGVGQGCYIDQVIGQWWASLTGLGRIYSDKHIRQALHSLWKYNFVPEIGSFRQVFKQGRFYAMPNEAGLVMCTWPKGGLRDDFKKHWQYAYFNECMSGFEWQVAAHMVWEGNALDATDFGAVGELLENSDDPRSLTARGLAVGRAVHDRYSPAKRNPYNEIECSDHYARANASYALFLAVCGFYYNGPAGVIGFAPKLSPQDFRAPFTTASGWGTFEQHKPANHGWSASIHLAWGELVLNELRLPWLTAGGTVKQGDVEIRASFANGVVRFAPAIELKAGGADMVITCT